MVPIKGVTHRAIQLYPQINNLKLMLYRSGTEESSPRKRVCCFHYFILYTFALLDQTSGSFQKEKWLTAACGQSRGPGPMEPAFLKGVGLGRGFCVARVDFQSQPESNCSSLLARNSCCFKCLVNVFVLTTHHLTHLNFLTSLNCGWFRNRFGHRHLKRQNSQF